MSIETHQSAATSEPENPININPEPTPPPSPPPPKKRPRRQKKPTNHEDKPTTATPPQNQNQNGIAMPPAIPIASTPTKLLVLSLGNPAPLLHTLHSAGHTVLEAVAEQLGFGAFTAVPRGGSGGGAVSRSEAHPYTLWRGGRAMNESGVGVRARWEAEGGELVVVHDELEVGLGRVVVRKGGGSARGHNGIKSLLAHLPPANRGFVRIAVGIGRPASRESADVAAYVLRKMTAVERRAIEEEAAPLVVKALRELAFGGGS
ncbi:MAG: hypothetical protein M1839_005066 [Geoglossum umbratile]|nr:MAG: hypothetical protein M1839_005066 [Geoglossum umbratile]